MKHVLTVIIIVLVVMAINNPVYSFDYQILLPDRVELGAEHNWNSFNEYTFNEVNIKFIYNLKEQPRDKLIIDNVDNLYITKDDQKEQSKDKEVISE